MGRGPFSRDTFARGGAPAVGLRALSRDRFKEQADRLAARKGGKPAGDAFARAVRSTGKRDASSAIVTPQVAEKQAEPRTSRVLANGVALTVVASQPLAAAGEAVKRDEKGGERKAAKSSTFVLLSSASVVEAPAPVKTSDGGQGPLAIPPLSSPKFRPKGGGRGGAGNGGGATPPHDRIFNQDDLAGVLVVLAVLLLMALYLVNLFRGNSAAAADPLLDAQSATAEPAAAPAPPADPFGNQAVDLTPKSPPPELALAAAPAAATPAPAPVALEVGVHAYFCTDKSELTPASAEALDKEIAAWGDRIAGKDLVVAGYADTRGEAVYNTWLGGERAKAVVNYLTAKGFKATALAVGELPDLTDNQNCANQRRVDVRLADAPSEPSRSCAPPPELAALACIAEKRTPSADSEPAPEQ